MTDSIIFGAHSSFPRIHEYFNFCITQQTKNKTNIKFEGGTKNTIHSPTVCIKLTFKNSYKTIKLSVKLEMYEGSNSQTVNAVWKSNKIQLNMNRNAREPYFVSFFYPFTLPFTFWFNYIIQSYYMHSLTLDHSK